MDLHVEAARTPGKPTPRLVGDGSARSQASEADTFVSAVLVLASTLTVLFAIFVTFVWAALNHTVHGSNALPSNFDTYWILPFVLSFVALGLTVLPIWRTRSRPAIVVGSVSIVNIVFLLVICPFYS